MNPSRYHPIVEGIAARSRSGQLTPGMQLPTVRALMQSHGIALATAHRVYAELRSRGLAAGETGRGTFVRDPSVPRAIGLPHRGSAPSEFDLTFNYPTLLGQAKALRDALRERASSGNLSALLHSSRDGARPHERATAAKHLRNRGVRVPANQLMIVNRAQQGLAATLAALLQPGDVLTTDALTYPGIKALAHAQRLMLYPLPPLEPGVADLEALQRLLKRRPVRAIYTMATLQSLERARLLQSHIATASERNDVDFQVEDSSESEAIRSQRGGCRALSTPQAINTPMTVQATATPSSDVSASPSSHQPPRAETTGVSAPKAAACAEPSRLMASENVQKPSKPATTPWKMALNSSVCGAT
jgi:Bacterial regulatory proteins, gntR family